jgi:hypothetical protein
VSLALKFIDIVYTPLLIHALFLVNQNIEMEAREQLIRELFFRDEHLKEVLVDHGQGVSVIQKILATGCVSNEERMQIADAIRSIMSRMSEFSKDSYHTSYKRLFDELAGVPSADYINEPPMVPSVIEPFSSPSSQTQQPRQQQLGGLVGSPFLQASLNGQITGTFYPTPLGSPHADVNTSVTNNSINYPPPPPIYNQLYMSPVANNTNNSNMYNHHQQQQHSYHNYFSSTPSAVVGNTKYSAASGNQQNNLRDVRYHYLA